MKKAIWNIWIKISIRIEKMTGMYKDISRSKTRFTGKSREELRESLDNIIRILYYYPEIYSKNSLLFKNKLIGLLLISLELKTGKKFLITRDLHTLREYVFKEKNLPFQKSWWVNEIKDNYLKELLSLCEIVLGEGE